MNKESQISAKIDFSKNRYIIMMVTVGLLNALTVILISNTWLIKHYELRTLDYFFRYKIKKVEMSDDIALVIIDDSTIREFGWPLPRKYYAMIIQILDIYKAKVIALDVLFTDYSSSPEEDKLLADVTEKNPKVIHNIAFGEGNQSSKRSQFLPIENFSLPGPSSGHDFPSATSVIAPIQPILESAKNLADVSLSPDDDGIIRRLWAVREYNGKIYPSLGLASASLFLDVKKEDISIIPKKGIFLKNKNGFCAKIPIDSLGRMLINYANPESFEGLEYSFLWLIQKSQQYIDGNISKEDMAILENLRDKIVFIGRYTTGDTDLKPTPFAPYYPMVRVYANVASNIIQQNFIQQLPNYQGPILALTFGLLMSIVTYIYGPLLSAVIFFLTTFTYIFFSFILFINYNWLVPFIQPTFASLLSFSFSTFHRYIYEKKRMLKYNENIMETMKEGIIVVDHAGHVMKFNRRAEEILNIEGANGKAIHDVLSGEYKQLADLLLFTINNRSSVVNKEIHIDNNGNQVYLDVNTSIFQDEAIKGIGGLLVIRDVSEVRILQKQIQIRERLSAIGRIANEISHEIKNALQGIRLFAENLIDELGQDDQRRIYVDGIIDEAKSLSNELRQLNEYVRPVTPKFEITDINALLNDNIRKLSYVFEPQNVKVTRNFQSNIPGIPIDKQLFEHIIGNLFMNAVDAMPNGGELTVETRMKDDFVELLIKDTGTGIPDEIRDHIFDPYFTTKEGKGSGLGLSIVHKYVELHNGTIQLLETKLGKGTTFMIRLPVMEGSNNGQSFSG